MTWPKKKFSSPRSTVSSGLWALTDGGAEIGDTKRDWELLFIGLGLGVFGQFLASFIWEAKITTNSLINWIFYPTPLLANTSLWQFLWAMIAVVLVWRFQRKFIRVISGKR